MKNLSFIIGVLLMFSCDREKECTVPQYCFTGPSRLRVAYFDSRNKNMLDPTYPNRLEIARVAAKSLGNIEFKTTSTIGGGAIETGFWHLDISKPLRNSTCTKVPDCGICINEECELYIAYPNSADIDTLNILYEQVDTYYDKNCFCSSYPLKYIKFNGNKITEFDQNHAAAIIRKF